MVRRGQLRAFPTCSAFSRASFTSVASLPSCLPASPTWRAKPSRPLPVPGMGTPSTLRLRPSFPRPRTTPPTTPAAAASVAPTTGPTADFAASLLVSAACSAFSLTASPAPFDCADVRCLACDRVLDAADRVRLAVPLLFARLGLPPLLLPRPFELVRELFDLVELPP